MSPRAEKVEQGFTWLWRGAILACIVVFLNLSVKIGEKIVTTFIGMSKDVSEIKGHMKSQDDTNAANQKAYTELCERMSTVENDCKLLINQSLKQNQSK